MSSYTGGMLSALPPMPGEPAREGVPTSASAMLTSGMVTMDQTHWLNPGRDSSAAVQAARNAGMLHVHTLLYKTLRISFRYSPEMVPTGCLMPLPKVGTSLCIVDCVHGFYNHADAARYDSEFPSNTTLRGMPSCPSHTHPNADSYYTCRSWMKSRYARFT